MKNLRQFICEALKRDIVAWLQEVYDTMQKLIKNNKLEPLDVDVKQLNKPQKPFQFDDFANDQTVKKIMADKQIGFTVTNQMFRMPKKYLIDNSGEEEKELKPKIMPYWYRPPQEKNEAKAEEETNKQTTDAIDPTYFVGIILYDTSVSYVDNFAHIVGIEASLCVKESTPLLKAMLNDWALHTLNKEGEYTGLTAKPIHPKMKAILTKLGFSSMKDNKDILTYKL